MEEKIIIDNISAKSKTKATVEKCRVLLNNAYVTVVDFGGMEIQFPSIEKESEYVFVEFDGDNYKIAEEKVTKRKKKTKETE